MAARSEVDWIVPISHGDSHRQFRVMGTTPDSFNHYKYRRDRALEFEHGEVMNDLFDTVIGYDVAETLGYAVGDPIVVAHGLSSFSEHEDQPFRVSGILGKTGTPVDRTVIISMEGIEAIHVDWKSGAKTPGQTTPVDEIRKMDLTPKAVTAALIGVKSPLKTFKLQRSINEYREEPLLAILPGVALQELWAIVGIAETALLAVSIMVVVTALIGLMATIFSSLNERRREMAIMRAMGASPLTIFGLLVLEAALTGALGAVVGICLLSIGLAIGQPIIDAEFGLFLPIVPPSGLEAIVFVCAVAASAIVSAVPAYRAYRLSLVDGMTVRS